MSMYFARNCTDTFPGFTNEMIETILYDVCVNYISPCKYVNLCTLIYAFVIICTELNVYILLIGVCFFTIVCIIHE